MQQETVLERGKSLLESRGEREQLAEGRAKAA